jgi:catechol 2,3-dioxygenase-like lactoylglutathione lyase family enzyme
MNIIDHMSLTTSDFPRGVAFYSAALAPLGISVVMRVTEEEAGGYAAAGFGKGRKPSFWLEKGARTSPRIHLAFVAESRAAVDAFHAAALAAGGKDNGSPGLRPHYHPDYYGAFVLDPDGQNIEAVCHAPA